MTPDQLAKSSTEHGQQRALFAWADQAYRHGLWFADQDQAYTDKEWRDQHTLTSVGIPQLKWLHAIHNQGHGDAVRGARAKAEGVKAGVSDIFLPVPTFKQRQTIDGYPEGFPSIKHGLYIELKSLKNKKVSKEQSDFKEYCDAAGYECALGIQGWRAAKQIIIDYLGLK